MKCLRTLITLAMFSFGFPQSVTTYSCSESHEGALVEPHNISQTSSDTTLMRGYYASPTIMPSHSTISPGDFHSASGLISVSNSTSHASQTSSASYNTPLAFGSRILIINYTSTNHCMITGHCPTATAAQTWLNSSTPGPNRSLVTGSGVRYASVWSHVFLWAALAEFLYFLN